MRDPAVSYAFSMAQQMLYFRELLKPGTKFTENNNLYQPFEESKCAIVSEIEEVVFGSLTFETNMPCQTGWAETGVGFWLFQKHCNCPGKKPFCCHDGWRITSVGSRFTNSTESRYTPVERETLAVVYGLNSARFFVLGCET